MRLNPLRDALRRLAVSFVCMFLLVPAGAFAQEQTSPPPASSTKSFKGLFADTGRDILRLGSKGPLIALAVGGTVAAVGAKADTEMLGRLTTSVRAEDFLDSGAALGSGYVQIGAALGTYTIGRVAHRPAVTTVGADLVQAQLVCALLTTSIKVAVDRQRPDGANYSFPSGHTSSTFATADVLARHFGWKVGAFAYAGGLYVAMSRISENHHYLSDVLFGAAVGIASSRTVSIHAGHTRLSVTPMATRGGAAILFSGMPVVR